MWQQRCLGALTITRGRSARRRLAQATAGVTVVIAMVPASAGAVRPGNLLAWGSNNSYTLGDGSGTVQSSPVYTRLLPGVKVVGVSGGLVNHTLAVTNGGGMLGWGANFYGKLGDKEQDWHTRHPVAADLAVLEPDEYITAVAAGYDHSIALTSDDRVVAFGYGGRGQMGDGKTAAVNTIPVRVDIPADVVITAISAGIYHNLALSDDGDIYAWGDNDFGALGDGTAVDKYKPVKLTMPDGAKIVSIAAGRYYSVAATEDGKVLSWGLNEYGDLGNGTVVGSVPNPTPVTGLDGLTVKSVAVGWHHSFAITSTGAGYAWGADVYGSMGDGEPYESIGTPKRINAPDGVKFVQLTGGIDHSAGLTSEGKVLTWGYGGTGQLGNGKIVEKNDPGYATLAPGVTISSIDAGVYSTFAITGPPVPVRGDDSPDVEAHERLAKQQPAEYLLRCFDLPIMVLDVYRDGNRVRVSGVAKPEHVSKDVFIHLLSGGSDEIVATTSVGTGGTFMKEFAAPPASVIGEETTRYRAVVDEKPSNAVKLTRRLNITSVSRSGGTVTVRGRLTKPFASPLQYVKLNQVTECGEPKLVAQRKPDPDGFVTFKVPVPTGTPYVLYGLNTNVAGSGKVGSEFEASSPPVSLAL